MNLIIERTKLTEQSNLWRIFLLSLFVIADAKFFTKAAQDGRELKLAALQTFYKQQSTVRPNADQENAGNTARFSNNNIAVNPVVINEGIKTYLANTAPRKPLQLAIALPGMGKTMRKNKLHKTSNKTDKDNVSAQKDIDVEEAQRWRFRYMRGTSIHLKDIFMGKCWDYQNRFRLEEPVECRRLWEAFIAGFSYKEPCDTTLEDYKYFFEMIHEGPLVNKSMLWSGSHDITHELSSFNARFTALEDTFAGYLLDGMQWCGMIQEPGINYNHCPYECAKQKAFWGAAAKQMAKRSEGIVYAVINGTRQHWKDKQIFSAYMMDSYMARNQVPNLDAKKVKEVRIMVTHSLHRKVLERCGLFSVNKLQKQIESLGIKTSCVDDPLSIRALMCLDYAKDDLCQFHLTALL